MRRSQNRSQRCLNVGCGRHWHADWENLDLVACAPAVKAWDITQGLPENDSVFDAVYHSHLLEHLTPQQAQSLFVECFRVLKPGGILRVVVPDLEQIARIYLRQLEQAAHGDTAAARKYEWIKLELLDQMVRTTSGGLMGPYMSQPNLPHRKFIESRMGQELSASLTTSPPISPQRASLLKRCRDLVDQVRVYLARFCLGKKNSAYLDEALFRQQGEIHRWMYDRYSLQQLGAAAGFSQGRVCSAFSSEILDFQQFGLDTVDDNIRKPDSLFMEFYKPSQANPASLPHRQAA